MTAVLHSSYCQFTLLTYVLGKVGWITQLVVDAHQRRRYIATSLLQQLKGFSHLRGITAIGIMSSHPAACQALTKYAGMCHLSL